jgi:hypothetical protein
MKQKKTEEKANAAGKDQHYRHLKPRHAVALLPTAHPVYSPLP